MKKITFPHIGDAHLYGRILFHEIGIELVTPTPNNQKTLETGSAFSPDEICLPFKLMLANLMEAYSMGADTVIMPATMGPCRLGEYAELLKSILDKRGFEYHWILLDSPQAIGKRELFRRLSEIVEGSECSKAAIIRALNGVYQIMKRFEHLEEDARRRCGTEKDQGSCMQIVRQCRNALAGARSIRHALRLIKAYSIRLNEVEKDRTKLPLKLILTGEIYSCIEPFANHYLEDLLMDMGVAFEKRVTLGWWIRSTILNPLYGKRKGNAFLPYSIGGYAKETVEDGIHCSRNHYDGMLQIFPVGCMPEIVAKSIFSRMAKEKKLRVLTIIFDEMGGEAGYITRVEAFIDMLYRQKGKRLICTS